MLKKKELLYRSLELYALGPQLDSIVCDYHLYCYALLPPIFRPPVVLKLKFHFKTSDQRLPANGKNTKFLAGVGLVAAHLELANFSFIASARKGQPNGFRNSNKW